MNVTALLVFLVTYVLISSKRLDWLGVDRPGAALLGAVACVILRVLTPEEARASIDGATLLLLFGTMGLGAFLAEDGFFDRLETKLVAWAGTPRRLLAALVFGAGIASALVTNDAVCVLGAPLVVRMIDRHRLPPLPFLLALATAANTGSVATLVGNPQNMLCATLGHLDYTTHLVFVGPVALVGLCINFAWIAFFFRRRLQEATLAPSPGSTSPDGPKGRSTSTTLVVLFAVAIADAWGAPLDWAAVAGFSLLLVLRRGAARGVWTRIDWSLLLFFGGLFVVVAALVKSGAPALFFRHFPIVDPTTSAVDFAEGFRLAGLFLVGSNVVSNVPFILVIADAVKSLPNPEFGFELLAVASTFAGNLTLLGSVANVIVAESAREHGGIGFLDYAKVGFPLALVTTALGTAWLVLVFP